MKLSVNKTLNLLLLSLLMFFSLVSSGQNSLKIAKLKYNGGGDWYAAKTALPNLIEFCNRELSMSMAPEEDVIEAGSKDIFLYPYVFMTGHGNVVFSESEALNLRTYLI